MKRTSGPAKKRPTCRGCGKATYPDEAAARVDARSKPSRFGLNPKVYECKAVGGEGRWHITSRGQGANHSRKV